MSAGRAEHVDILVLGSGEGGKYLAWHLARAGHRTAVVERRWIGGSCPNINCLPSKNEIWSAKIADLVRRAEKFGMVTGSTALDMVRVRERKRDMVDGLIAMHLGREGPDSAEEVLRRRPDEEIDVLLGADVLRVEGRSGASGRLRLRTAGGEQTIAVSDILAATGRTPNTAGIALDVAGVDRD